VVPHVAAPETHQQLWKISFVSPKRLFRQYRPISDIGEQSIVALAKSASTSNTEKIWVVMGYAVIG
jgi:hypothetical protein